MYVPAAVLIGGLIDKAIGGRMTEGVVVTLGAGLLLVVSPAYSLTTTPQELVAPGIVLIFGVILVVWAAPIRDRLNNRLPTPTCSIVSNMVPLLIAIILVGSFIGVPQTSAESPQQALAEELNRQSPESEPVFIERNMERPFHTFSFYAQHPLESGHITELESSRAQYAILTEDSLSQVDTETRIIMNRTIAGSQQVSLVEVDR
jgi:hypothetical protein